MKEESKERGMIKRRKTGGRKLKSKWRKTG